MNTMQTNHEFETDAKLDAAMADALQAIPVPPAVEPDAMTKRLQQNRKPIQQSNRWGFRVAAGLCAALIAAVGVSMVAGKAPDSPLLAEHCYMENAGSYRQLYQQAKYLDYCVQQEQNEMGLTFFDGIGENASNDMIKGEGEVVPSVDTTDGENLDYSDTRYQVEGIAEADLLKTDGKSLYYVFEQNLWYLPVSNGVFGEQTAVKPDFGEAAAEILAYQIQDMYLENGVVTVLYRADAATAVVTYAPNAEGDLVQTGLYWQEGGYCDSRVTDNVLYLITLTRKPLSDVEESDLSSYVPYCGESTESYLPAEDILIPDDWQNALSYTLVSTIDLQTAESISAKAFTGASGEVYMSQDALYLTLYDGDNIRITRVTYENHVLVPMAVGKASGHTINQYAMHERNGVFYIATTDADTNWLRSFDGNLQQLDEISYAPGERIKAVNFTGDRAYVVTFLQTDPLYSIDCSDPANLVIDDEFKISGYSTFLYPWNDLLFSFGMEQTEFGEVGIKLMMYRTDENGGLTMLDDYQMVNNATYDYQFVTSPALYDADAIYLQADQNRIGIPIVTPVRVYYAFFSYENNAFVPIGTVESPIQMDGYVQQARCVSIGDYVYCVFDQEFASARLSDLSQIDKMILMN